MLEINYEINEELSARQRNLFEKAMEFIRQGEAIPVPVSVSLTLVDGPSIQAMNRDLRQTDAVTDVLSFPLLNYPEGETFKESMTLVKLSDDLLLEGHLLLGDVVICLERAKKQSKDFGHSLERELTFLFVHSLLHLCGYDHIIESQGDIMRARERHYMNALGVAR